MIAVAGIARSFLEQGRLDILRQPGIAVCVASLALMRRDGCAARKSLGAIFLVEASAPLFPASKTEVTAAAFINSRRPISLSCMDPVPFLFRLILTQPAYSLARE